MKRVITNVPELRASYQRLVHQLQESEVLDLDMDLQQDSCTSLVFKYFRKSALSLIIMAKIAAEKYPEQLIEIDSVINPVPYTLAVRDLSRVIYPIAATAWLTTDHFRWHTLEGYEAVPEDLSYGLVLQYFEPVIEATRYFLSPTGIQRHRLSREDLRFARNLAVNAIQTHCAPSIDEAAIRWQLIDDSWA